MRAWMLSVGAAVVCAGLTPAIASAATLTNSGGRLVYTGEPGEQNSVEFGPALGAFYVGPMTGSVSGCTPSGQRSYRCLDVDSVTADLGDGDDRVWVGGDSSAFLSGGPGDDDLILIGHGYGSVLNGGPGLDTAYLASEKGAPVTVTLDGDANDGVLNAMINVAADVENVGVQTAGTATLTGNAGANALTGGDGADALTGGAGSDVLSGHDGNDTLDARDGETDRVECGNGADTALVDAFDDVSDTCEQVQVSAVPSALEDHAPRVEFKPGALLEVTANDDRGIVSVHFRAGDRVLCTDTTAPYTCAFRPRVEDVGRKTIVAVAVDGAGQTATAVRSLVVPRFTPDSVSLKVKRQGKRFLATGKVTLPDGVPCAGDVMVKAGKRTRTAKLSKTCTFRVLMPAGGVFVASYRGTAAIEPARSNARSAW